MPEPSDYASQVDDLLDAFATDPTVSEADYYSALSDFHQRIGMSLVLRTRRQPVSADPCNTCGGTGRWQTTTEESPTQMVDLGPCQECASGRFPLPGTQLLDRTVVASCPYIDDDDREPEVLVLLLNKESPFFKVAHVQYLLDPPVLVASEDHFNIVPAVEAYQQWGGDY